MQSGAGYWDAATETTLDRHQHPVRQHVHDHTIEWLSRRGYLHWGQRGQGEAIIAAVNAVIGRHR